MSPFLPSDIFALVIDIIADLLKELTWSIIPPDL